MTDEGQFQDLDNDEIFLDPSDNMIEPPPVNHAHQKTPRQRLEDYFEEKRLKKALELDF